MTFPGEVWYSGKADRRKQQQYPVQIVQFADDHAFAQPRPSTGKEKLKGIAYVCLPEDSTDVEQLLELVEDEEKWSWMKFSLYCKYLHEHFERNPAEKTKENEAAAAKLKQKERRLGILPRAKPTAVQPKSKHKPEERTTCARTSPVYEEEYWKDTGVRVQASKSGRWGSVFACQMEGCNTKRTQVLPPLSAAGLAPHGSSLICLCCSKMGLQQP
jgi:hypothetical protein